MMVVSLEKNFLKPLPASLFQREEKSYPALLKGGKGGLSISIGLSR